jgi:ubiquinone/menaquinone biosynthesis C-methylase UbiE
MTTTDTWTSDLEWSKAGAQVYDDVITASFAIYHHHVVEPYLHRLAAEGARRVLDVGCGTGALTVALARRGMDVVAVDHSPYMLEVAERKARELGVLERISFVRGDATMLPFSDEAFDAVTCQRMLHHLMPTPDDVVIEIVRVTRPGGSIYICEPTTAHTPVKRLIVRSRRLRAAIRPSRIETPPLMRRARHEAPIDPDHVLRLLDEAHVRSQIVYLTPIGRHRYVPERVRWGLIQAVSWPWRRSRGDLLFIFATKR